ncbi:AAA family ATPase [Algihabitans albus]|uniref:AAA family ATPase n=1 Tax=Algihabitans albus TaxID=2164067 RepID=UPI000E5D72E7|nr:ATP-binding protein [Algihabitans albus]
MRNRFVKTANVRRFLGAVQSLDDRGAPEASLVLATGDAGYGKSRCGVWFATTQDAAHVRVHAASTPNWLLTDIVRQLGEAKPARSSEKLFGQAVAILAPHPRPIVVDEVEHALRDLTVIETIRDLSDACEIPVILIGREHVVGRLKRERQIWTRIHARAEFGPATEEDVKLCAEELCEVPLQPEVVARIWQESEGHIREVVKALKTAERVGLRHRGKAVTAAMVADRPLCQDHQRLSRKAA